MVASCGAGHWLALKASTSTCWSGKLTGKSVVSPGMSIVLCLICTRGVLCVVCCALLTSGTWSLGDNLVSGVVLCVVCCVVLTSGTWSLGDNLVSGVVWVLMQCRQVVADICSTGNSASLLVLGTV